MARPEIMVTIETRMAWWSKPYVYGLITFAILTGAEPDWPKVLETLLRGMHWRMGGGPWRSFFPSRSSRVTFETGDWRSQFELLPRVRIMPPSAMYRTRWGVGIGWGIWWLHVWV